MLIINGKLITWEAENRVLEGQALRIVDGKITEIGEQKSLIEKYPEDERMDADGQYVMPGNICAHTHYYGAYARGLAIPDPAPSSFPEILAKLWWPLDKALDEDAVKYSALVHLVDAIKHGTTTLFDHHASPNFIDGSLDVIADAVDKSGLRSVLCYEVTDRDGAEKAKAGIDENVRFIERVKNENVAEGRVKANFGMHASLTLSDETLEFSRAAVGDDVGFHIHTAESIVDEDDSIEKSGLRVVERLDKHGLLGEKTILVHGVHLDDNEIKIAAETGSWITHQPRSNMNNAVGVAPVQKMLDAGIKLGIGNDGFTQDMWTEWKLTYLLHKLDQGDPRAMNGYDVIKMGVYNNAALANSYFDDKVGELSVGSAADIILVDYHPFTPLHAGNLPWHILFGFNESMVTTTMVNGKVLMRDRKLVTLDEEEISNKAKEHADIVWKNYQHSFN